MGGAGIDTATYAASSLAVSVSLATNTGSGGDAAGDVLSGIENLIGSNGNDSLTGDGNANLLDGGAGNDTLLGGAGATPSWVVRAATGRPTPVPRPV